MGRAAAERWAAANQSALERETAAIEPEPERKSEQKREPIFGKGKEPIIDWEGIKELKPSPEKLSDLNATVQRYRVYGLYVVLILAGVLFIPTSEKRQDYCEHHVSTPKYDAQLKYGRPS